LINLSNRTLFYYLCLALLLATVYGVWRMINSRFGLVIQGARSNDRRMQAIGFPTFRYKLTCFVIAGVLCGLSGVLLANHTNFISPSLMHWTRSGDLIVMAVLGGMGTVFGPVIGAVALLVLEETLPHLIGFVSYLVTGKEVAAAKEYWQLILGPMLLLIVIYARGGIEGLIAGARRG
jgi:branched-chain amino acid transport system permease protein